MIHARTVGFAALVCTALTWSAMAEPISASRADVVLPACKLFPLQDTTVPMFTAFMTGQCAGIVLGVAQFSCPPKEAKLGLKIRAVVAYVEARPARAEEQFEALALEAVQALWPCPKKDGK